MRDGFYTPSSLDTTSDTLDLSLGSLSASSPGPASEAHREHVQANAHPRASSIRLRRRQSCTLSSSCWVTSTYATVTWSPALRARVAMRCSSDVPLKNGRADGSHECVSCIRQMQHEHQLHIRDPWKYARKMTGNRTQLRPAFGYHTAFASSPYPRASPLVRAIRVVNTTS